MDFPQSLYANTVVTCRTAPSPSCLPAVIIHSHYWTTAYDSESFNNLWPSNPLISHLALWYFKHYSDLKICINFIEALWILRQLHFDIFRTHEDRFQMSPCALHFKPHGNHLISMAQLWLPWWNLLQEMCNKLWCNKILQLYLQHHSPVNVLLCDLDLIHHKRALNFPPMADIFTWFLY